MKLLFIIILFFSSVFTFAQDTIVEPRTITNTEQIVDKYVTQLNTTIVALAEQLKVPAEHVYQVLTKQQIVLGITSIISCLISILIFLILLHFLYKEEDPWEEPTVLNIFTILSGILSLVTILIFLTGGITCLLNPEYGAINDIISIFK